MPRSRTLVFILSGLFLASSSALQAQDTGPLFGTLQGYGARALGNAIGGAINRATDAIAQANGPAPSPGSPARSVNGPSSITVSYFHALPIGDALAGTDAPTYALANGHRLRASGLFVLDAAPAPSPQCVLNYSALRASGGYRPSGPPRDGCLNFGTRNS